LAVAPTLEHFDLIALTFQALSDATRLRIIWALAAGEQSVTQLVLSLGVSQPAVSHHLRMLRNLRLVKVRRSGRHSNYVLDDGHIDRLLKEALAHVEEFL
jgi:DNA-binding transcriptional ArsR family regulator